MAVSRADIEAELGPCEAVERVGSESGSGECWRVVREGTVLACKVVVKGSESERFEREVEALQRITSPRVVQVLGRGELTTASNGRVHPYLLSEFVDGGDVRAHLAATSLPSDAQLRAFIAAVLEGLEQLHCANVIHRDLKPENVVLRGGNWTTPVIIDLGLSRLVDLSSVTLYPWAGGTWPYMAPEQLRAERALDRTDLWALAVIVGELASGQHPFRRGEPSLPSDWDSRLQAGIVIPGSRPAGLRDWTSSAGDYAAYRRPHATRARELLDAVWP
jgi:eukaryotic-like serine/threonine-protein kinase